MSQAVSNQVPCDANCNASNNDHNVSRCCGCASILNTGTVIRYERVGLDWPSIVIAVVAVSGIFYRWVYGLVVRPKVKFKKAKRYNYTMPSSLPNSNSQDTENEEDIDFYVPIVNEGRSGASGVSVTVDCILESAEDGDSYKVKYFGMPMQMGWNQGEETPITIPAKDTAYFKFISFSSWTQSVNTPDADTEKYVTCSICSTCATSKRFLLSKAKGVTVLVRACVRAQNMGKAVIEWISLHWNGCGTLSEISKENFKIRLAEKNEIKKADDIYNKHAEEGMQS